MCLNRTSEWLFMTIWISWELPFFNFVRLDILCAWIGHPVKSYDHSNFESASVVQFWASRYFMPSNQTSEWKVMTIWITRELPLFNFESLDISWALFIQPSQKLNPFEFAKSFQVQFRLSRYIMRLNRISEWKVLTICITQELPLFNFECLDIMGLNHTPESKVNIVWICRDLSCSLLIVSIYFAHESDIWVKSYD